MAYTLAHVDRLVGKAGNILFEYLLLGPFTFKNAEREGLSLLVVGEVRPLPEAIPRLFADAGPRLLGAA